MDYSCRDIPMRLDIRHQPLNFDIYLSQVIEIPRTSAEEPPYDFQLEVQALERVDRILERTNQSQIKEESTGSDETINPVSNEDRSNQPEIKSQKTTMQDPPHPSCPTETLLTPIKSAYIPNNPSNAEVQVTNGSTLNQINPRDFEDTQYNPFDHLELQTIDELRELDLVFRASYANNQVQPPTNDSSTGHSNPSMITKQ